MKVVHCITGLTSDGAQGMLLRLVAALSDYGIFSRVISLQSRESLADSFEAIGVPVYSLGMSSVVDGMRACARLCRVISAESPDMLQGWMYHANAVLTSAHKVMRARAPLVWNIRRGLDDLHERSWKTRGMIQFNQLLSRAPCSIVYCTEQSMLQHENLGFLPGRGVVIGNGFDTARYQPRRDARALLLSRLSLPSDALLIGHVGRYDIAKGHRYLLEGFAQLVSHYPHAHLVCVGRGVDEQNATLLAQLSRLGLGGRVFLLGESSAPEELYPAFDIVCSSSIAEGFPNVIAEAMASGVPCVVTDTGASRSLVDGLGIVVRSRSSEALAEGLVMLCAKGAQERHRLGVLSRQRVRETYSIGAVSQRYVELYRALGERQREIVRYEGPSAPILSHKPKFGSCGSENGASD